MNPGFSGPGDDSDPRAHDCPGLLLFIYDDDFWGCELVHHGTVIDQFQAGDRQHRLVLRRSSVPGAPRPPAGPIPALDLDIEHARAYLTHYSIDDPAYEDIDWENEHDPRNSPARAIRYGRLEGGVYGDFQNFLGVDHHARSGEEYAALPQAPTRTDN